MAPPAPESLPDRPSRLWRLMNESQRRLAAEAFWADETYRADHGLAFSVLAERLKFRPRSVMGLPLERRARALASTLSLPDALAGRLLIAYHLGHQRPMMAAFLDALAIPHDGGLMDEETTPDIDAGRLRDAVSTLRRDWPTPDVGLYFATLRLQDPDTWAGLAGELAGDAS